MSGNPYAFQSDSDSLAQQKQDGLRYAGILGFIFAMVYPALGFLEMCLLQWDPPRYYRMIAPFSVQIVLFNLFVLVFIATATSIPLGYIGLRSSHWRIALLALVIGTIETVTIYFIKLHPLVMAS